MSSQPQYSTKILALETEARRLGGGTTANQRRFMKAAKQRGKVLEPIGVMASSLPVQEE